jgi:WD40 repeat protein/serine/threonine protein kinase
MSERSIFLAVLDIADAAEREAFLDRACAGEPALRGQVEQLLKAHQEPSSFMERPAHALVGTSVEPAVPEGPGTVIGPYKLLEQIGEGGFGVVFMAEQTQPLRRKVALKIVKPGMDTRQVVARFEAERQALARMDHPHIARVLDAGAVGQAFQPDNVPPSQAGKPDLPYGRPYFVMELVRGIPITDFCDANRLTPRQRLELFIPVCQAVQHAHQKGIIHRDLKPSNVLVTLHDGVPVVKVIDFGIAKALGEPLTDKTLFTGFAQMLGTPRYMSPEQAELSGLDVDTRSDIYSLGVLLYELLTGTAPLDGERLRGVGYDELRRLIREEEPPRPSTRISTLGEAAVTVSANRQSDPKQLSRFLRGELDWIVMKALEKDRTRRYETASALAADVQRYLADEPVEACPPSALYRFRKLARRRKGVLLTAAVVAAAVVLAAVALAVSTTRTWQANQDLHQSLERERQNAYYTRIALAEREWSANNLSRMQQLLEECPEDLRGWEWHYLQRLRYQTLRPLHHACAVHCAVFSPDGRRVASSDQDGWVKVWDAHTGQELLPAFRAHQEHVRIVAFSPDGKVVATGSSDGTVKTWDAGTGQQLPARKRHGGAVWGVAFSPDGRHLASGTRDGVEVWDVATGQEVIRLHSPAPHVFGIAFSPDGQRLAAASRAVPGGADFAVTVWDVRTGNKQLTLGPALDNYSVAFSPDGRLLAASGDNTPRVWDSQTGQELLLLRGHTAQVHCNVAFSPDGRRLASGSGDAAIKLWDLPTGREVLTLRGHAGGVRSLAFSPDGHRLLSASADGTVRIWDARPSEGEPDHSSLTLPGHTGAVNNVAFHPQDPRLLASAGADGTILLWDARSGKSLQIRNTQSGNLQGLAFSPDGQRLAFGGGRSAERGWTARIWDATTWQDIPPWPLATEDGVRSVAFSPDGRLLAAGCYSKKPLTIWEAGSGKPLLKLPNPWVTASVAFRPDGRWLAAANFDGTVQVWDVATGEEVVRPPLRHGAAATSVAFRSDGKRLASASMDQTVTVWDTSTWEPRLVLSNPTGGVLSVVFSPDGQRLAWGSTDSTVKVWEEASRKMHTLRGHTGWVNNVAFSPDGQQIASASADGTVRVWKAAPVAQRPAGEAREQGP